MPLYFIDVVAFLTFLMGMNKARLLKKRHRKIAVLIILFSLSLIPTTLSEYFRMSPLEPTYLILRTFLHIFAVWSLYGLLSNINYLKVFIIGIAAGVLFTSSIATLNSLPVTGPWVRANIFTIDLLKPRKASLIDASSESILSSDKGEAERGDSLLGKSNITGCVIITLLPFLIGAVRNLGYKKLGKLFLNFAIIASFFAILFTYSRSIYLGMAMMILGYLIFERKTISKRFLPLAIIAVIALGYVGFQSSFFKFEFLAEKFDLTNEEYADNNKARILAYTRPFEIVLDDPIYLVRGAGRANKKLRESDSDASILELYQAEMHSVFAASVFYRGVISMLLLFIIYYTLTKTGFRLYKLGKKYSSPNLWMASACTISLMALLPSWLFTHYLVSKISGHMYLFLLFGLIIVFYFYIQSSIMQIRNMKLSVNTVPKLLVHD